MLLKVYIFSLSLLKVCNLSLVVLSSWTGYSISGRGRDGHLCGCGGAQFLAN
jgi:hypothetical protein